MWRSTGTRWKKRRWISRAAEPCRFGQKGLEEDDEVLDVLQGAPLLTQAARVEQRVRELERRLRREGGERFLVQCLSVATEDGVEPRVEVVFEGGEGGGRPRAHALELGQELVVEERGVVFGRRRRHCQTAYRAPGAAPGGPRPLVVLRRVQVQEARLGIPEARELGRFDPAHADVGPEARHLELAALDPGADGLRARPRVDGAERLGAAGRDGDDGVVTPWARAMRCGEAGPVRGEVHGQEQAQIRVEDREPVSTPPSGPAPTSRRDERRRHGPRSGAGPAQNRDRPADSRSRSRAWPSRSVSPQGRSAFSRPMRRLRPPATAKPAVVTGTGA